MDGEHAEGIGKRFFHRQGAKEDKFLRTRMEGVLDYRKDAKGELGGDVCYRLGIVEIELMVSEMWSNPCPTTKWKRERSQGTCERN